MIMHDRASREAQTDHRHIGDTGAALPLRPLFFTKPTDQTAEIIDDVLSPLYLIGQKLPPSGDQGSLTFLLCAMAVNAIVWSALTYYIVRLLTRRHRLA